MAAANECYQRAVDVTPEMAKAVIDRLKLDGFACVVAPYEADGQMAYLVRHGFVDAVITEDSDMIPHQCKSVFYKMDHDGMGQEIRYADIVSNKELSFAGFTSDQFLEMCVMSGCDYLPSLPGVGIKRAHGLMRRFRSYSKALRSLRFEGTQVPRTYEDGFRDALLTFRHQWVYCPRRMEMVHLSASPHGGDPGAEAGVGAKTGGVAGAAGGLALERLAGAGRVGASAGVGGAEEAVPADIERLIGPHIRREAARGMAEGDLHPVTLRPYEALRTSRGGAAGGAAGGGGGGPRAGAGAGAASGGESLFARHQQQQQEGGSLRANIQQQQQQEERSRSMAAAAAMTQTPSVSKFFGVRKTEGGAASAPPAEAAPAAAPELSGVKAPQDAAVFERFLRGAAGAVAGAGGVLASCFGGSDRQREDSPGLQRSAQHGGDDNRPRPHWPPLPLRTATGPKRAFYSLLRQSPVATKSVGGTSSTEGGDGDDDDDVNADNREDARTAAAPVDCQGGGAGVATASAGVVVDDNDNDLLSPIRSHPLSCKMPGAGFKPPQRLSKVGTAPHGRSPYFNSNTSTPAPARAPPPTREEHRDTPIAASQDAAGLVGAAGVARLEGTGGGIGAAGAVGAVGAGEAGDMVTPANASSGGVDPPSASTARDVPPGLRQQKPARRQGQQPQDPHRRPSTSEEGDELELDVSEAGGRGERLGTDVRHCASFDAIAKFALDNVVASAAASATRANATAAAPADRPTARGAARPAAGPAGVTAAGSSCALLDLETFRRAPLRPNAPARRHAAAGAVGMGRQRHADDGDGDEVGGHDANTEARPAAPIVKRGLKRPAFTPPAQVKRAAGSGPLFENFRA